MKKLHHLRLVLNGKKADAPGIREAVAAVRKDGHEVDVRVTWEAGDAGKIAAEALTTDVDIIVAAGGDGTVHEVVNGIFSVTEKPRTTLAVVPLGSANDFATGCGIPMDDPITALRLAATGEPSLIDVGKINDLYFINALVMGFGAEVSFSTSVRMKKALGRAAYHLQGFLTALQFSGYTGLVRTETGEQMRDMVFASYGNGIQAGGVKLTARAKLDDGKLDVCAIPKAALKKLPLVMREISELPTRLPTLIRYTQHAWIEVVSDRPVPISPDGEELFVKEFRVEVLPRCLNVVLPPGAPLVGRD